MPISALRQQLDAALLDFAWGEWAQMGVLASAPHRSPWAEDPEALILFTLEVARDDARLFDELLDWLLRNEPLISVRRLRTFARDSKDRRLLDAVLGWVDAHRPRARLRGSRQPRPPGAPARLFADDGFPIREPDPAFMAAGLLRPSVLPSRKAQAPDLGAPINFAFRLRQLLGVGARGEVARVLLTAESSRVGPAEVTASAGYARRNVMEALASLQQAGVVSTARVGAERRYSVDRRAWAGLLGLDRDELPEARDWPQLLSALARVRRWLRDVDGEELSAYMLGSRARDLLDEIAPPLSHAGVQVAQRAGSDTAWDDLEKTVSAALTALLPFDARTSRGGGIHTFAERFTEEHRETFDRLAG
jgi:DNA-binding transcriptional ArsR family regulator